MRTILVQQPLESFLLGVHNLSSMAARVPTHVPALGGHMSTIGAQAFTYHACSLSPNPHALGLRRFREYFTCARLECTKQTTRSFR